MDPNKFPDKCQATQILVFELNNVSNAAAHVKIDSSCGEYSREDYIKAHEKLEYQSVTVGLKAFDACKIKWGCPKGAVAFHDPFRSAKDFDNYYDHYLPQAHKNWYGDFWDANCKAAYEKKHPPAAPSGKDAGP